MSISTTSVLFEFIQKDVSAVQIPPVSAIVRSFHVVDRATLATICAPPLALPIRDRRRVRLGAGANAQKLRISRNQRFPLQLLIAVRARCAADVMRPVLRQQVSDACRRHDRVKLV
jgi:hypothetical protein